MTAPLSGLLNVFKPADWTSRDVVNRVERLVKPSKAGHAGTLDPMAVGVLVVCVGTATRLITGVQEREKEYHAVFQLGCRSDTDDRTGEIVPVDVLTPPTRAQIEAELPGFLGEILQTPPQFSAVHVAGQRAYALARQGQRVDLAARPVTIHRLELISYEWPRLELMIECGSGTYIRSIGRDLGDNLGCGAIMTDLVRTRIGPFLASEAISVNDLTKDTIANHLQPGSLAVSHWPQHVCSPAELWEIAHGRQLRGVTLPGPHSSTDRLALLSSDGQLAALAERRGENRIAATQVFVDRTTLTPPAG